MIDTIHFLFILWIGLCLGSFASVLAYRWPRGLPWTAERSKCPSCDHVLGARDLIPVVSWVISGGKCRYCQAPISKQYPLLEIVSASICLILYGVIGWRWELIPVLVIVPFGMAFVLMRIERR